MPFRLFDKEKDTSSIDKLINEYKIVKEEIHMLRQKLDEIDKKLGLEPLNNLFNKIIDFSFKDSILEEYNRLFSGVDEMLYAIPVEEFLDENKNLCSNIYHVCNNMQLGKIKPIIQHERKIYRINIGGKLEKIDVTVKTSQGYLVGVKCTICKKEYNISEIEYGRSRIKVIHGYFIKITNEQLSQKEIDLLVKERNKMKIKLAELNKKLNKIIETLTKKLKPKIISDTGYEIKIKLTDNTIITIQYQIAPFKPIKIPTKYKVVKDHEILDKTLAELYYLVAVQALT